MKKFLLIVLTALMLLAVAACGKKPAEKDPNAVLTDSNVPLEVGAEVWDFGTQTQAAQ